MSRLYDREFRLVTAGLDLSEFRVTFDIQGNTTQSPRTAVVTIYNLSEATAQSIPRTGAKIEMVAGYKGLSGRIFQGDVKERHIGRANPTDTYVRVFAAEGDRAYTNAVTSEKVKAGATPKDTITAAMKAMKEFGISPGYLAPILSQQKDPRAQALFGMSRDLIRKAAMDFGCTWFILDGKANVLPAGEALPGDTVVLNSETGMIGRPVQTDQGIIAQSLINARIHEGGKVKIDEKSIDRAPFDLSFAGAPNNAEPNRGSIATDGIYKVQAISITGDTRGNPWYMELICNALGQVTSSSARLGRT